MVDLGPISSNIKDLRAVYPEHQRCDDVRCKFKSLHFFVTNTVELLSLDNKICCKIGYETWLQTGSQCYNTIRLSLPRGSCITCFRYFGSTERLLCNNVNIYSSFSRIHKVGNIELLPTLYSHIFPISLFISWQYYHSCIA